MDLAIAFTNFGPYHLARLRALGAALRSRGDQLTAYELAGTEERYPWKPARTDVPFRWITLFPDRSMESLSRRICREAMTSLLDRDPPDGVAVVGYSRPESVAMLHWARRNGRPAVLMSESQAIDHPRVWWKETIKRNRIRRFDAALVGGPRHRDYLIDLGMPGPRIVFGYNAVDNDAFASRALSARTNPSARDGLPSGPYFLSVSRFVPEKNLGRLVDGYAAYRSQVDPASAWDLVLCGGGPSQPELVAAIEALGLADVVHLPGFLQDDALGRWYAFASAFVHPSLMEPWGLVVNEAAACGLPLLVSDRAGCVDPLVPAPPGTTGRRIRADDVADVADGMTWLATQSDEARLRMGANALRLVAGLSPEQFARGTIEALAIAEDVCRRRRRTNTFAGIQT